MNGGGEWTREVALENESAVSMETGMTARTPREEGESDVFQWRPL